MNFQRLHKESKHTSWQGVTHIENAIHWLEKARQVSPCLALDARILRFQVLNSIDSEKVTSMMHDLSERYHDSPEILCEVALIHLKRAKRNDWKKSICHALEFLAKAKSAGKYEKTKIVASLTYFWLWERQSSPDLCDTEFEPSEIYGKNLMSEMMSFEDSGSLTKLFRQTNNSPLLFAFLNHQSEVPFFASQITGMLLSDSDS